MSDNTHDELDGLPEPDIVFHTIGMPGYFTDADVEKAVAFQASLGSRPTMLTVSGYDDDPRELWEIPEARSFIARFVLCAMDRDVYRRWNLADRSKELLAICVGEDPRNLSNEMAKLLGSGKPQAAIFDELDARQARKRTP